MEKFEPDRQNWTTYSNFKLMCGNEALEMVDSSIVVELEEPLWNDENSIACIENDSCGFQVTHDIANPSYFLMTNEVGGNLS